VPARPRSLANSWDARQSEEEAAQSYSRFLDTKFGKSLDGLFDATDYLMPARRYNEAADNLMLLDSMQNHVEQHRAGAEPNDDLTMMCLNLKL
jgi:hypothetical protein